jgi:S1-C subfamily serine protease
MLRRILPVCLVSAVALLWAPTGRADDKKTDADTKVAEGTEVSLTPAEVTISDKTDDEGRIPVTVKPAKEAKKVKMPAQAWALGFYPEKKDRGIGVAGLPEDSNLHHMRVVAGKGVADGDWQADAGDIITYANGYAVNSVEDLICAISVAKNPEDVQLVIKDVNTGKETVFYVTATKK